MKAFTVLDLLSMDLKEHNALELRCIGGRPGLTREIHLPDLNRPGLALSGFYDKFGFDRIQIFGRGETSYLNKLEAEGKTDTVEQLFERDIPCAVFTHGLEPTEDFRRIAEGSGCPILQTDLPSSEFSSRLIRALSNVFAPHETIHGVLVEVFGRGETSYLNKLEAEGKTDTVEQLFERDIPCAVFTHGLEPTEDFRRIAEGSGCPILQTDLPSSEFSSRLIRALSNVFAPHETIHGVLVEVFGIGVLILGDSGVGKSEAALELIERGHRLVADDAVDIRCVAGNILLGAGANQALGHHMEIRGLGIINITHLFGVGAIRDSKQIQMIVELELWDSNKQYDRIGAEERTRDILGVQVPYLQVPVKPGRNVPIIIETAAMNERLKKMGYFSAKEFNQSVLKWLESEHARNAYFQNRDIFHTDAHRESEQDEA